MIKRHEDLGAVLMETWKYQLAVQSEACPVWNCVQWKSGAGRSLVGPPPSSGYGWVEFACSSCATLGTSGPFSQRTCSLPLLETWNCSYDSVSGLCECVCYDVLVAKHTSHKPPTNCFSHYELKYLFLKTEKKRKKSNSTKKQTNQHSFSTSYEDSFHCCYASICFWKTTVWGSLKGWLSCRTTDRRTQRWAKKI